MEKRDGHQTRLHDFKPERERFRAEVLSGLLKPQKELPSKYFYDERGSHLYERICALEEYYIPWTEAVIMKTHIREIVELLGSNVILVEYGCGNCAKTRILLDNLKNPAAFVPIDISREQLLQVADELALNYPFLEVLPVCADYTSHFKLPVPERGGDRIVVFFPGSTIGNFEPGAARNFMEYIAHICRPGGALLIGVDLKKDPAVIHNAYNDPEGVTAAFNINLLERINRELDSDFQAEWFRHHAFYNSEEGRVEMHLISRKEQVVHLDNVSILFTRGESIWTESSYKYNLDEFARLAAAAGFEIEKVWTDKDQWFSVQYLVKT